MVVAAADASFREVITKPLTRSCSLATRWFTPWATRAFDNCRSLATLDNAATARGAQPDTSGHAFRDRLAINGNAVVQQME
jgi:hypothetical protein